MNLIEWIRPSRSVEAHCDLPCGIYDPEQARIEAESVYNIIKKYNDSKDDVYRQRAVIIKEERAELAKHHLDVLWSDWYKPEKHDAKFPQLKDVLKQAVTQGSKVKGSVDLSEAQKFLDLIDQVDQIWEKAGGPQETRVARQLSTDGRDDGALQDTARPKPHRAHENGTGSRGCPWRQCAHHHSVWLRVLRADVYARRQENSLRVKQKQLRWPQV